VTNGKKMTKVTNIGRKGRRSREQQELRQSILTAAREIALTEGWRNVTMRKIAEHIEYSHAAIYDYFENKDVLFQELVHEGFRLLHTELQATQTQTHDSIEALQHIGRGYLTFAWRYPELYRVMYGLDGVNFTHQADEGGQLIDNVASEAIKTVLVSHNWSTNHLAEKVYILWSTAHGLVALTMANQMQGGQSQAIFLLDRALHDALLAWEHDS
jgi:AcrR family transcriptional regulator